jgi:ketosteroid isomerase-like protein
LTTKDVLDHHLEAFAAGDVDEVLKDFTDDSVLLTADGPLRGLDALRPALSDFLSGLFKPGTYTFEMDRMEVDGDVAFVVWHADCAAARIPLGTDTFVVRDGKIAVQTFAAKIEPK